MTVVAEPSTSGSERAAGALAVRLAHGHDELIPCISGELLDRWPDLAARAADTSWPSGQDARDVHYLGLGCVLAEAGGSSDPVADRQVVERLRETLQSFYAATGFPSDENTMDCVMLGMFIDATGYLQALAAGRAPTVEERNHSLAVFDACEMDRQR